MKQQLYTYQYRKPRPNNPTYISNNVSSSLSFYNLSQMQSQSSPNQQNSRYDQLGQKINMKQSKSNFSLPKINRNQQNINTSHQNINLSHQNIQIQKQNIHYPGQYGQYVFDSGKQSNIQNSRLQNSYKRASSIGDILNRNQKQYPNNKQFVNLNQKDIFMKQGHNYNIITYQPKQFNQHIKKYPKLSLQQKDQYFRLKYINDTKFNHQYSLNSNSQNSHINPNSYINHDSHINPQHNYDTQTNSNHSKITNSQKIAGMHTYRKQNHKQDTSFINNNNSNQQFINKQIIQHNLDAINTKSKSIKQKINPRSTKFDMKLLNNMDQFNYYA